MLLIALAIAILLLALTLTFVGFRGKRVSDHPHCRKCRFDLVGVWPDTTRCPECGRELTDKRVRNGLRKKRRLPLAGGAFLLIVLIGVGTAVGVGVYRNFDFNTIKPVWWLLDEAEGEDTRRSDAAITELRRRQSNDLLDEAAVTSVFNLVLRAQSNKQLEWNADLGTLVELARSRGRLDDDRWRQYLRTGLTPIVVCRKRADQDLGLVYRIDYETRYGQPVAGLHVIPLLWRAEGKEQPASPARFSTSLPITALRKSRIKGHVRHESIPIANLPGDEHASRGKVSIELGLLMIVGSAYANFPVPPDQFLYEPFDADSLSLPAGWVFWTDTVRFNVDVVEDRVVPRVHDEFKIEGLRAGFAEGAELQWARYASEAETALVVATDHVIFPTGTRTFVLYEVVMRDSSGRVWLLGLYESVPRQRHWRSLAFSEWARNAQDRGFSFDSMKAGPGWKFSYLRHEDLDERAPGPVTLEFIPVPEYASLCLDIDRVVGTGFEIQAEIPPPQD